MVMIEEVNITAELISKLEDKRFIVSANPFYKEMSDVKEPDKRIRKLIVPIILYQDRTSTEYIPNKQSIKTMVNLYGLESENWVGKFFQWYTQEQNFLGMTKQVAYVKNEKTPLPEEEKEAKGKK